MANEALEKSKTPSARVRESRLRNGMEIPVLNSVGAAEVNVASVAAVNRVTLLSMVPTLEVALTGLQSY